MSKSSSGLAWRNAVVLGLWIGLITGVLEALVTYATRFVPMVSRYRKSSELVFWVAPLTYAVLFAIAAVLLATVAVRLKKIPAVLAVVAVLALAGCFFVITYPTAIRSAAALLLSAGVSVALCRGIAGREQTFLLQLQRRLPLAVLGTVLIAAGVQGWIAGREYFAVRSLPAALPGTPNVLVVVVDALRGDRLSSAGYARPTTPNLDQFGRSGIQYDFAFSTSPWSTPSHNTMLTGRHGFEHGMDYPVPNLRHGYPHLPEVLARHGYRSGLFSANVNAVVQEYMDAGFHHYDTFTAQSTFTRLSLIRRIRGAPLPGVELLTTGTKWAPTIVESFMDWATQNTERPFFAMLNLMDLHNRRFWQREELARAIRGDTGGGEETADMRSQGGDLRLLNLSYDEGIERADRDVAALLESLDRHGLSGNTVVIVTADHGDSVGEHGFSGHASSLYIEQLRVPILIRWPGHVPAAVRIRQPVSLVALPATVMTLLKLPQAFPGAPWPVVETPDDGQPEGDSTQKALLAEFNNIRSGPYLKSLLTSRWHYIVNVQSGKEELYEWSVDPGELHDLAASASAQPVLEQFRAELKKRVPGTPGTH